MVAQIHLPEADRKLDPREGLAVRFAERLAIDFRSVDRAFKTELREHFEDKEIAELGFMINQYIALGRLLVVAGGDKLACEIYTPEY
ncbi:MAG TPA: hypothetical protein EYG46_12540 [Myxococcales bacterium]|jgi:alkylhydroperoxidase family enzyme|nr:hypothetical protein [Myxococcales bacterium]HIM01808.1 hypothetical protein [Myxococcales bacterium]